MFNEGLSQTDDRATRLAIQNYEIDRYRAQLETRTLLRQAQLKTAGSNHVDLGRKDLCAQSLNRVMREFRLTTNAVARFFRVAPDTVERWRLTSPGKPPRRKLTTAMLCSLWAREEARRHG